MYLGSIAGKTEITASVNQVNFPMEHFTVPHQQIYIYDNMMRQAHIATILQISYSEC